MQLPPPPIPSPSPSPPPRPIKPRKTSVLASSNARVFTINSTPNIIIINHYQTQPNMAKNQYIVLLPDNNSPDNNQHIACDASTRVQWLTPPPQHPLSPSHLEPDILILILANTYGTLLLLITTRLFFFATISCFRTTANFKLQTDLVCIIRQKKNKKK